MTKSMCVLQKAHSLIHILGSFQGGPMAFGYRGPCEKIDISGRIFLQFLVPTIMLHLRLRLQNVP